MEARVTSQSQPFRLRERMEEAKVSHGQELRADLPNVRVTALAGSGEGQALFCNMGPIGIREVLHRGDDRPLPIDVALQGLEVPISGTYDIFNALVSSNGDIRLVVDDKAWVVPAVKASRAVMYHAVAPWRSFWGGRLAGSELVGTRVDGAREKEPLVETGDGVATVPPHASEQELSHLRPLRDAGLDVLKDLRRTAVQKLEAIERLFSEELDEEEEEEEARDRERLS